MTQQDIGFTAPAAATTSRAAVLLRRRARRRRRVAADPRVARRDGRRVGAVRGVGQRLQHGDIDTALVYAFGKSSPAVATCCPPARPVLRRAAVARLRGLAALQARAARRGGTRARSPGRARRSRAGRHARTAAGYGETLLASRTSSRRCASTTARRSPTAPRSCSPPATGARSSATRPAWIRGIDHRIEPHALGVRDLTTSPSTGSPREKAGVDAHVDVAELHAPFTHQELDPARRARARRRRRDQPVGRRARRQPGDGRRPDPHRRGAPRIADGRRDRAVAHATRGPCLQQNLVCVLEGAADEHEPGRRRRHRPDEARRQARRTCRSPGSSARRRRARSKTPGMTWPTSTPSSSARRPTCSKA